jgi:hypothetical protein
VVVKGREERRGSRQFNSSTQGEIRNEERARRGEEKEGETAKSTVMMAL